MRKTNLWDIELQFDDMEVGRDGKLGFYVAADTIIEALATLGKRYPKVAVNSALNKGLVVIAIP